MVETVISARDLETIDGLLAAPSGGSPRDLLPVGALEGLTRLFPGATAGATEVDELGTVLCSQRVPAAPVRLLPDRMQLTFPVNGPGRCVRVFVQRGQTPFTARDQVLFRLLGPLLEELVLDLSHQRELEQLSPSELRVLALVAHGASNREVSARLSLSVATVRKHLEHVYRKLGVCNRTAAVARAFPHSIS
jgi:DNA-binding CsgD family transcriptional regulator